MLPRNFIFVKSIYKNMALSSFGKVSKPVTFNKGELVIFKYETRVQECKPNLA